MSILDLHTESCRRCEFSIGDIIDDNYVINSIAREDELSISFNVSNCTGKFSILLFKLWELISYERMLFAKRVVNEYNCLKQIHSIYFMPICKIGEIKGNLFILMSSPIGESLLNFSKRSKNVDYSKIAFEILSGLKYLHQNGLYAYFHSLMPSNIFINDIEQQCSMSIAGSFSWHEYKLAYARSSFPRRILNFEHKIIPYLSPRIYYCNRRRHSVYFPIDDIYSFGILMHYILTKEFPFGFETINSLEDAAKYFHLVKHNKCSYDKLQKTDPGWLPLIKGCIDLENKSQIHSVDDVIQLIPNNYKNSKCNKSILYLETQVANNGLRLRIMTGEDSGTVYNIANDVNEESRILTLGKKDSEVMNHIPITENDSNYISRCHCTIEYDIDKKEWLIRDGQYRMECNIAKRCFKEPFPCKQCTAVCPVNRRGVWKRSLNGTYVNSTEVDENGCFFKPGDIISIGDVTLRVEGY